MKLYNPFTIPLNSKIENSILITSIGRSGSTLLQNVLSTHKNMRTIFEPFHIDQMNSDEILEYPTYISPSSDKKLPQFYENAFRGKVFASWINKNHQPLVHSKRVIKSIRTNLLLPQIVKQFPDLKIILLIRNPFAQVSSHQKSKFGNGFNYLKNISYWLSDINKDTCYFRIPMEIEAKNIKENLINRWCIETSIALNTYLLNSDNIFPVFYKDLVNRNMSRLNEMFSFLQLEFNQKIALKKLSKSSRTTFIGENYSANADYLNKWKAEWSEEERINSIAILKEYKLNQLMDNDFAISLSKLNSIKTQN